MRPLPWHGALSSLPAVPYAPKLARLPHRCTTEAYGPEGQERGDTKTRTASAQRSALPPPVSGVAAVLDRMVGSAGGASCRRRCARWSCTQLRFPGSHLLLHSPARLSGSRLRSPHPQVAPYAVGAPAVRPSA